MTNLPIKNDKSFFGKIKSFFRKLFYKQKTEEIQEQPLMEAQADVTDTVPQAENKNEFQEALKVDVEIRDVENEIKREELLDKIEENPEMLYEMPLKSLEKVERYYIESIKMHDKKLAQLNNIG